METPPIDDLTNLCTPQSHPFPMPPAPCSEDYDNADFLQKIMEELCLNNANLPVMDLQNSLEVSPPFPNRCDSPYLDNPMEDTWWTIPRAA